ncbi:hypothetical protein CC2G_001521 [Coprinopsis cinerea AmutBmut pab1-1]|nr:hypothetical protein CC2G_001521 [Coprinopsis cinerea AmutBmut pab1-1]
MVVIVETLSAGVQAVNQMSSVVHRCVPRDTCRQLHGILCSMIDVGIPAAFKQHDNIDADSSLRTVVDSPFYY